MPQDPDTTVDETCGSTEVIAWAQDGRLVVVGESAAVDAFVADLEPKRELDLAPLKGLATGVGALSRSGAVEPAKRYVELAAQRWKQIAPSGTTPGPWSLSRQRRLASGQRRDRPRHRGPV